MMRCEGGGGGGRKQKDTWHFSHKRLGMCVYVSTEYIKASYSHGK